MAAPSRQHVEAVYRRDGGGRFAPKPTSPAGDTVVRELRRQASASTVGADQPEIATAEHLDDGTCALCARETTRRPDGTLTHLWPDGTAGNPGCRNASYDPSGTTRWDMTIPKDWRATAPADLDRRAAS